MTDYEATLELYKRFGVKVTQYTNSISIENDGSHGNKIGGYYGFGTDIDFDENGKFICQYFSE